MIREWSLARRRSRIQGRGVFALEPIPAGAPVLECRGRVVREDDIPDGARVMQVGPQEFLVENGAEPSFDDFLNHSCQPNLGFLRGTLTLYALRRIKPGEELVWDYSTSMNSPGWSIKCRCGARRCRGRIQSFADLPAPTRRRLRRTALAFLR